MPFATWLPVAGSAAGALAAGLLATPHCAAMCGGFAVSCAARRESRGVLPWHAGRLAGYALLGALAGGAGRAIPGPAWAPAVVAAVLLAWAAASLAGLVPAGAPASPLARPVAQLATRFAGRPGVAPRAAFGLAVALLPCGMVYAALGAAVASGSALAGASLMLVFGAATLPGLALAAAGLRRVAAGSLARRRLVAAGVLVAGLVAIALRLPAAEPATRAHAHHGR